MIDSFVCRLVQGPLGMRPRLADIQAEGTCTLIPRGEVGPITASLGFAAGLVSQDVYAQVVILVPMTTPIAPVLLRFAFPGRPIESTVDSLGVVEIPDVDAMSSGLDSLADA
jgi:hypothetical protein